MTDQTQNGKGSLENRVVAQDWEESERGWGVRPDGRTLHLTLDDCKAFIEEYWAGMLDEVPDEYSRPSGKPYITNVDDKEYQRVTKSKYGVWSR